MSDERTNRKKARYTMLMLVPVVILMSGYIHLFGIERDPPNAYLLEDLRHFLHVLENNFDLIDVAYWAHGIDIRKEVENVRKAILADPYMCADGFYTLMANTFWGHIGGHFAFISPIRHYRLFNDPVHNRTWEWFYPRASFERMSHPHVLAFYEPRHYRATEPCVETAFRRLVPLNLCGFQPLRHLAALHGEKELADEFYRELTAGNYYEAAHLRLRMIEIINSVPAITMEIIEEGRIAYLSINGWMDSSTPFDEQRFLNFYEYIRGFEHLIVDMRKNGGGAPSFFTDNIIAPNIDSPIRQEGYVFFRLGHYNRFEFPAFNERINPVSLSYAMPPRSFSTREMLSNHSLPGLNMNDMERMTHGFLTEIVINPRRHTRFDFQPAFDGKVWLLTDSRMISAAEYAARISKNSGFATLVGERTGGHVGGARVTVSLPNTGILFQFDTLYVTDQFGRPFDAGTYPHHFNREGLNALETTLQLIAEGLY